MKKKIFLIAVTTLILAVATALLAGCGNRTQNDAKDNVSRRTDAYFAGECEQFAVSIEKGRREKTFIADGKATDVIDFCRITVIPLKSNDYESVNYVITGDGETLSGEIKSTEFAEYFQDIDLPFVPKTVSVTAGSDAGEVALADLLEGKLTATDAVNVAKDAFKDKLAKEKDEGKPEREIYVKLITGDRTNYYYYVSFIGDGVDYLATLIDPATGNVISKR